jgi:type IV secretory pathway VirB10-like protein
VRGRTWLWIALGALGLITVCCIGALLGGALARREAAATQAASQPLSPVAQVAMTQPPREASPLPTSPSPTLTHLPTQPPPTPLPTVTAFPTPPPPPQSPSAPPASSDLQALVDYANAMQPMLEEAGALLERDGQILEASEGGNDVVLCDGRLAADNAAMAEVLRRTRGVTPPAEAAAIHDLVLRSGDAWTEALDNVDLFCRTQNQLYKIPAVLKFWEAATTLQDAANRFWLLLVATGVEDWVQR